MTASVVSTKGQIVIPAKVRAELGVDAGTRIEFIKMEDGWSIKAATLPVKVFEGILRKPRKPVTVDEIGRVVRRRARR